MKSHMFFAVLVSALFCAVFAQKRLGTFTTRAHGVRGEVFAINDQILEIRGFYYDGKATSTYFWVSSGPTIRSGTAALVTKGCNDKPLPAYNNATVQIELPNEMRLSQITFLAVWCDAFHVNFGEVQFTSEDVKGVPVATGPSLCGSKGTFPVQRGWNCEELNMNYQVRWQVIGSMLDVELVGKVDRGQYMGFGVSGRDTRTTMLNADVVIAHDEGIPGTAVDYHLSARMPCFDGLGVCPDVGNIRGNGTNNVDRVESSRQNDMLRVQYTRPLVASDAATDKPISVGFSENTYVVWAIGPIIDGLPHFHGGRMAFPRVDVVFMFGREPVDNCATLLSLAPSSIPEVTEPTMEPSLWGI